MAKGSYTDCPECGQRILKENLKAHLRKVHEQGPAAPKKGPRTRASRPRPFNALRWALVSIVAVVVVGAAYYLVVRDGFPHVPAIQATSLVLAGGFLISAVVALATLGPGVMGTWVTDPTAWAMILIAGSIGAAFPKVLVIRSVRAIGGSRASLIALIEPVTGVVVATLALGQMLEPREIVGGMAILAAAAIAQRREPSRIAPAEADLTVLRP